MPDARGESGTATRSRTACGSSRRLGGGSHRRHLERFSQSRSLKLTVDRREIGPFALPDAAAAARAFSECETGKLVGWGADPSGLALGATRPRPVGDRFAWTRELAPGAPGSSPSVVVAVARLNLSREGSPERCTLMESNRVAQVDWQICGLLMQRGRFEPALDRNGNPVSSVYLYQLSVVRTNVGSIR
jgi:hypothetical protein